MPNVLEHVMPRCSNHRPPESIVKPTPSSDENLRSAIGKALPASRLRRVKALGLVVFIIASSIFVPLGHGGDPPVLTDVTGASPGAGGVGSSATVTALIRVGIYDNTEGTAKGPKSLRRFLVEDSGFKCLKLSPSDIQNGRLSEVDVLIMPGGSGSAQAKNLGEQGREAIRDFVRSGGGYVGICAGSYLASAHYSWSLNLINAQVVDREHWARGTGTCRLKLTAAGKESLSESQDEVEVYYGQGPLLAPHDNEDLPAYETLAEYATEIAKKGAPTGVMIGTTAIARAGFGEGRVICFSPHPEVTNGPNHLIVEGVEWAAGIEIKDNESNDEN